MQIVDYKELIDDVKGIVLEILKQTIVHVFLGLFVS